ncbi:hypothetical protein Tco_1013573, partial [Tanacetum coccineum]
SKANPAFLDFFELSLDDNLIHPNCFGNGDDANDGLYKAGMGRIGVERILQEVMGAKTRVLALG